MKTSIWMPFYFGDYFRDTTFLNRCDHGSYLMMIGAYWSNGGPLPSGDDEFLREIAKCDAGDWVRTKGLLLRFFVEKDGFWHHNRIDAELTNAKVNRQKAKAKIEKMIAARRNLGQLPKRGKTLPGQTATVKAESDGASQARVDSMVTAALPEKAKQSRSEDEFRGPDDEAVIDRI